MYQRSTVCSASPCEKAEGWRGEDVHDHNDGANHWPQQGPRCLQAKVEGCSRIFWSAGDLAGRVHRVGGWSFDLAWRQLLLQHDALPVHSGFWETRCGLPASKRQGHDREHGGCDEGGLPKGGHSKVGARTREGWRPHFNHPDVWSRPVISHWIRCHIQYSIQSRGRWIWSKM